MTRDERLLFGERVRNRRDMLNLTQEYIAEKVGISIRFYQALERGEKGVSLNTLIGLSKALDFSIDYLLFGDLSYPLKNPMTDILNELSQQQRTDALTILQIYANACKK